MKQGYEHLLFTVTFRSKDHNFLNSQYFTASQIWDGQPDSWARYADGEYDRLSSSSIRLTNNFSLREPWKQCSMLYFKCWGSVVPDLGWFSARRLACRGEASSGPRIRRPDRKVSSSSSISSQGASSGWDLKEVGPGRRRWWGPCRAQLSSSTEEAHTPGQWDAYSMCSTEPTFEPWWKENLERTAWKPRPADPLVGHQPDLNLMLSIWRQAQHLERNP